jgi:hypothetical protein
MRVLRSALLMSSASTSQLHSTRNQATALLASLSVAPHSAVCDAAARSVLSLVATGGGVASVAWLFGTAGASSSLMFAEVPYSRSALTHFLGHEMRSKQSCSREAGTSHTTQDHSYIVLHRIKLR